MPQTYSATEHLRDGREVEIRVLRPDDKDDMLAAVGRTGAQSLQRRFFAVKRGFSEKEISFFMNVDFVNHVALVALVEENQRKVIAGGGRYIVTEPGKAEIAFVVIDDYQGQGIGTLLMRHLAVLARSAGLRELIAEVLPENAAMRKVFGKFGFQARRGKDPQVVHLALILNALKIKGKHRTLLIRFGETNRICVADATTASVITNSSLNVPYPSKKGALHCRSGDDWPGCTCLAIVIRNRDRLRIISFGIALVVQASMHHSLIERILPFGDDDRRNAVAYKIGERARFGHEAVDAKDQGDARNWNGPHGCKRSGQNDEAGSRDTGGALRSKEQNADDPELLPDRQGRAGCLCQEYRGHCQVNAGAIEVE